MNLHRNWQKYDVDLKSIKCLAVLSLSVVRISKILNNRDTDPMISFHFTEIYVCYVNAIVHTTYNIHDMHMVSIQNAN